MQRPGQKIKMTSLDELLCVPTTAGTKDINVNEIFPFENHPFKVLDDEKMDELVESIKENGILTPVIVRPDDEGTYEMISGHRRLHAAKRAGLEKIPAIVKEMTDDDATIYMVDSNLQREEILPSEKAFSYKMKLDAMRRQGYRSDLTSAQPGHKSDGKKSRDILAEQAGVSKNQISRFIRLTELIPELLNFVDSKRIPLLTAVEMSYFTKEIQQWLYEYCRENGIPKFEKVSELRNRSDLEELTQQDLIQILNGIKPTAHTANKITFSTHKLNRYFPKYMPMEEREKIIISLLEKWKEENGED